jgi:cation:H+ antiporter
MIIILLVGGFVILIKGADLLVSGASSIAKSLKVSELVIGLTVVAFGTSAPELFVNITASVQGNNAITLGNILGSNIVNILLILGISSIIHPLKVSKGTVWKEIPLGLLATILFFILINDHLLDNTTISNLGRTDGIVFLAFFIIFMYYTFGIAKDISGDNGLPPSRQYSLVKSILYIIIGLIALVAGGKWVVDGAIKFARLVGASENLIGLTIIAVGTSLPELATSVVAAFRKNSDIAVGNIVGSNIFNIFFILGISALIKPVQSVATTNIDLGVLLLTNVILFLYMFTGKKRTLDRWEGALFIIFYIGYIVFLINRG